MPYVYFVMHNWPKVICSYQFPMGFILYRTVFSSCLFHKCIHCIMPDIQVLTDVIHFTLNVDSHSKGDVIFTLVVPLPHVMPTHN
jgi:hypothetical protein